MYLDDSVLLIECILSLKGVPRTSRKMVALNKVGVESPGKFINVLLLVCIGRWILWSSRTIDSVAVNKVPTRVLSPLYDRSWACL